MKIIKVNALNPTLESISEATNCLKKGGVLVYPTDTCYGLGADMSNSSAIEKIYKIKKRRDQKPLSIIIKDITQLKKIAILDDQKETILRKFLPGPFTFILLSNSYETFNQSSIGVRIPKYKLTQLISDQFVHAYATTSANISGKPPCYDLKDLFDQFGDAVYQPNLILDAGELPRTKPSTVVDLSDTEPKILRQGSGLFK